MKRQLTILERDTLALVLEGKSNKEIADELGTDEACIKSRVRCAFRILGIRSTRQLLPIAQQTKELLHLAMHSA
jgi:DNA-binding CsgD family transcriptional regulator